MARSSGKPKLLEQVLEIRYERGYRYLDRCGEAMLLLEGVLSEKTEELWMPGEMQPKGAVLMCPELELQVLFDTFKLVIIQTPTEREVDLRPVYRAVFHAVTKQFDIQSFIRFGGRRVYLMPTDSAEEADSLSVSVAPTAGLVAPPGGQLALMSFESRAVFESPDHSRGVRFVVQPARKVEVPEEVDQRLRVRPHLLPEGQREALLAQLRARRKRQEDPDAGLVLDVDYYWIKPAEPSVDVFLDEAWAECDKLIAEFGRGKRL